MEVVTVRVDEKTRKELDQMVEELGGSTSEVIRKAIHLSASGSATLLRKGTIFLITLPAHAGDHTREGRRYAVVVTAANFIGSVVTVASPEGLGRVRAALQLPPAAPGVAPETSDALTRPGHRHDRPDRAQEDRRRPDQRIPESCLANAKHRFSGGAQVLAQHTPQVPSADRHRTRH